MTNSRFWLLVWFIVVGLTISGAAQKTKIGYDKSADFSKYKTYSWAKPDYPPVRPQLYQAAVGTIDKDLQAKGLQQVDANGDLILSAAGGIDFGYNMHPSPNMDSTMWNGADSAPILMAPLVAQGTLILQFMDRSQD
jgi:hypothetical protein